MLFAALEALLVAAIGVAIPLVPLTLVWALHFGFAPAWPVFGKAAVDIWLIGHGVDVTFTLDPALVAALGLVGADAPVKVTIALLGFALLTVLLGARAGRRIAEAGHAILGVATALVVFAALALGVTAVVLDPAARPSLVQAAILPALVFGAGLGIGVLRARRGRPLPRVLADRDPAVLAAVAASLRAGIGAAALTVAVAAVLVTLLFVAKFADMIGLYEALHTEVVGGVALTAGQLALTPNVVIWAVSWLVGPGFAIGIGSHVSPVGTALGPVPAVPILGALPTGDLPFGFAGVLVPVAAAFVTGAAVRSGLVRELGEVRPLTVLAVAAGSGVAGGLLLGVLAAASAGSAGPGRLAEVGPDALAVGLIAAAEFAVATGIGLAAASRFPVPRRR